MVVTVGKRGNSYGITLSPIILDFLGVKKGDKVKLSLTADKGLLVKKANK